MHTQSYIICYVLTWCLCEGICVRAYRASADNFVKLNILNMYNYNKYNYFLA